MTLKDIGQLLDKFIVDEKADPHLFKFATQQGLGEDNLTYPGKD